jgi:hypothetical protein
VILSFYWLDVPSVFGVVVVMAVVWLAVARLRAFVLFLALFIPFEGFLLKWLPAPAGTIARYVPEIILAIGMLKMIGQVSVGRKRWFVTGMEIPAAGLVLISVVSCRLNDISVVSGLLELRLILRYVFIALLLANVGVDRRFVRRLIIVVGVAAAIQAGIGFAQAVGKEPVYRFFAPGTFSILGTTTEATVQPYQTTFIRGTLTRYTNFGNFICLAVLLLVAFRVEIKKYFHKLITCTVPVLAVALLLSVSRQAGGALIAGLLTIAGVRRRMKWVLLLLVVVTFMVTANSIVDRISGISPLERYFEVVSRSFRVSYATFSTGSRWIVLRHVPVAVWRKPLLAILGTGPGGSRFEDIREMLLEERLGVPAYLHVHDVYWVRLLVAFGIIGMCAWLCLLYRSIVPSLRLLRRSPEPLHKAVSVAHLSILAAICVMALFGDYFETRETSVYLWIMAGVNASLWRSSGRR